MLTCLILYFLTFKSQKIHKKIIFSNLKNDQKFKTLHPVFLMIFWQKLNTQKSVIAHFKAEIQRILNPVSLLL